MHTLIYSLATDDYDRIWIGTEKGISSFDGSEWKLYKAINRKMTYYSIYVDSNDNKWIGTEKALLILNQDGIIENTYRTKKNIKFEVKNMSIFEI